VDSRAAPAIGHKSVLVSIGSDVAIAVTKLIVAVLTGSSAMLSEAIHSWVDSFNSIFLLVGERLGRRPPDRAHPLGYGKETYFWTLMVAVSIFAGGGGISIWEGVVHLIHPHAIDHSPWTYVVLGVAAVFEAWAMLAAYREYRSQKRREKTLWRAFRASKDLTTFAVLFENGAALLGVIVAFVGILATRLSGSPYPDAAASIVIGALLAVVAFFLIRESKELLIGEGIHSAVVQDIRALVQQTPNVDEVMQILTMQTGPHEVLLLMDVRFPAELTAGRIVAVIDDLERRVRGRYPDVARIFIEAECIAGTQGRGA
jgi:cation diffusion facilitator family transporter